MDRFAALADPHRRRMIEIIAAHGEIAATALAKNFDISAPAVSQHLKVLRTAGLVRMEKRAQMRIYTIDPAGAHEMWEWLSRMRALWTARFDALDSFLSTEKGDVS